MKRANEATDACSAAAISVHAPVSASRSASGTGTTASVAPQSSRAQVGAVTAASSTTKGRPHATPEHSHLPSPNAHGVSTHGGSVSHASSGVVHAPLTTSAPQS